MDEATGGRKCGPRFAALALFALTAVSFGVLGGRSSLAARAQPPRGFLVVDPVLNSTLADTAAPGGSEPSVALNPRDPNEVAITAFSDRWPEVFVGYAGVQIRGGHPMPWKNAKNVNFKGLADTTDASALRIDNPTTEPVTVDQVSVAIGTQRFGSDLWTQLVIPKATPGEDGHLILTATALTSGVESNFDGSDANDLTATAVITVTIGGVAATYIDTARVLTAGGRGPLVGEEGRQWTSVTGAPFWYSADGGDHWTRQFIPAPYGLSGVIDCPCDQTIDYGGDGRLYGAFLLSRLPRAKRERGGDDTASRENVVTGSFAADPAHVLSWQWNEDPAHAGPAQLTNHMHPDSADQPWLVARGGSATTNANVYVAYDDFGEKPTVRVAINNANNACLPGPCPPDFAWDTDVGKVEGAGINTGLRLSRDQANQPLYAVYEQLTPKTEKVLYKLNQLNNSDRGPLWSLDGKSNGILVAAVDSPQGRLSGYKFGGVNALFGGVDDVAVAPDGSVYVVYGEEQAGEDNQLFIRRFHAAAGRFAGDEPLPVCDLAKHPSCQAAALPSVAVTSDGTIGVLYDTFDGFEKHGELVKSAAGGALPVFSAHLARSTDQGKRFFDILLEQFASPSTTDKNPKQRVLGDYQQLKTNGNLFYGVFAGNRVQLASSTASRFTGHGNSAIDPIYFSLPSRAALPRGH